MVFSTLNCKINWVINSIDYSVNLMRAMIELLFSSNSIEENNNSMNAYQFNNASMVEFFILLNWIIARINSINARNNNYWVIAHFNWINIINSRINAWIGVIITKYHQFNQRYYKIIYTKLQIRLVIIIAIIPPLWCTHQFNWWEQKFNRCVHRWEQ